MERLISGDIVVIPFPFTDLSGQKKRPALVIANLQGDDLWLVQITSKATKDKYAISLNNDDLIEGQFNYDSSIRPNKIFTLSQNIVSYKMGNISADKLSQVRNTLIKILQPQKG